MYRHRRYAGPSARVCKAVHSCLRSPKPRRNLASLGRDVRQWGRQSNARQSRYSPQVRMGGAGQRIPVIFLGGINPY